MRTIYLIIFSSYSDITFNGISSFETFDLLVSFLYETITFEYEKPSMNNFADFIFDNKNKGFTTNDDKIYLYGEKLDKLKKPINLQTHILPNIHKWFGYELSDDDSNYTETNGSDSENSLDTVRLEYIICKGKKYVKSSNDNIVYDYKRYEEKGELKKVGKWDGKLCNINIL